MSSESCTVEGQQYEKLRKADVLCMFYEDYLYHTPLLLNKTLVAMHNVILFILRHVIINASLVCY